MCTRVKIEAENGGYSYGAPRAAGSHQDSRGKVSPETGQGHSWIPGVGGEATKFCCFELKSGGICYYSLGVGGFLNDLCPAEPLTLPRAQHTSSALNVGLGTRLGRAGTPFV